jgi:ABC-type antimicrobial peptide transport system permease subunit
MVGSLNLNVLRLASRGLRYYGRTGLAVGFGAAVGTATLTGALFVGDSMRAGLRDHALRRIGPFRHSLTAPRFFREGLALELAADAALTANERGAVPMALLRGSATRASSASYASRVQVLGVNDRFWQAYGLPPLAGNGRIVVLNEPLAAELGAKTGDDILLRFGTGGTISPETLLGRRDRTTTALRVTVHAVVPDEGPGAWSAVPSVGAVRNAFVPLHVLQNAVDQPNKINTILFPGPAPPKARGNASEALTAALQRHVELADFELKIRADGRFNYVALESSKFMLEPAAERAGRAAARELNVEPAAILAYLANGIAVDPPHQTVNSTSAEGSNTAIRPEVPYSTVAALDALPEPMEALSLIDGRMIREPIPGEVYLNEWTARELAARPGDRIRLTYYVMEDAGRLGTRSESFSLAGIVAMQGLAQDRGFTPEYPGVTDSDSMSDWDPPFPVDLKRVLDQDEAYWKQYRTAPKVFLAASDGRRLWASDADRFGSLTSLRIPPVVENDLGRTAAAFAEKLLKNLPPASGGFRLESLRERALAAGAGATDFAALFLAFSFFLILSAAMLVALLFRLHVERRAAEVGLLLALGFAPRRVTRLLLVEAGLIAAAATAAGWVGALVFARLVLTGLRAFGAGVVEVPPINVTATPFGILAGTAGGFLVAFVSAAWSLGRLARGSPRSLLAGQTPWEAAETRTAPSRRNTVMLFLSFTVAVLALGAGAASDDASGQSIGFFCGGMSLLVFMLTAAQRHLRRQTSGHVVRAGLRAMIRLGTRNARRFPGRSLLTVGLTASATFLLVAVDAWRLDPRELAGSGPKSGSGGYQLVAESVIPLPYDLNTPVGRDSLNVSEALTAELEGCALAAFRLYAGDESSCTNLYRPTAPRLLGASDEWLQQGRFVMGSSLAETEQERLNPWLLLRGRWPDGAVPAIGDESAVRWQLHSGLAKELRITDEQGALVPLRFVALLRGSLLQGELIVSEENFKALYPSISGPAFFLIEAPSKDPSKLAASLERELSDFGFDATPSVERLAAYGNVQNMYLSTFQVLGGLGMVLGALGLVAVMLRGVWERRREIALLKAIGFSRKAVFRIVMIEHAWLLGLGLVAGFVAALLAVIPRVLDEPGSLPWTTLLSSVAGVVIVALGAGALALRPALRTPWLAALRSE